MKLTAIFKNASTFIDQLKCIDGAEPVHCVNT